MADPRKMTGVLEVTIVRDLNLLKKQSCVGLMVSPYRWIKEDVETRMMTHFSIKRELATRAAELVNAGETVFIENGSRTPLARWLLSERGDITIITVSSYIAHLLKETPGEVIPARWNLPEAQRKWSRPLTRQFYSAGPLQQSVYWHRCGWAAGNRFYRQGDMMRAWMGPRRPEKGCEAIVLEREVRCSASHPLSARSG